MYLKNFFKNTQSIIIATLVSFFLLESLIFITVAYVKKRVVDNYLAIELPDFESNVRLVNKNLTDISKIFYDSYIDSDDINELMYEATKTNDKVKLAKLRKNLLEKLTPAYKYMKKYSVRQFHFHLPNAVSFLRFHLPNKFGDSLVGIRATLEYVNEHKTFISAFEEGRIFNGFRNVYPIYRKNKFVGTLEISFSFIAMQKLLSTIDETPYAFMIKDEIVEKKVFDSEKHRYVKNEFVGYTYDKNTMHGTVQIGLKQIDKINKKIAAEAQEKLKEGKAFSLFYKDSSVYNNRSIMASFVPILNLNNEVVAYIVHYEFGDFINTILNSVKLFFWMFTLLSLFLSALFGMILANERRKQEAIHNYAVHDALTGIYNRYGVNEIVNQKILEHNRNQTPLCVIFFDIDFFKKVNDTYGHDMGDYVLKNLAKLISNVIRSSDIFARWGGEEFIVFLPNADIQSGVKLAEKLRVLIEECTFDDMETITCSFGVTAFKDEDDKTSYLKRVDELLYKAKESGRNCVVSDFKS